VLDRDTARLPRRGWQNKANRAWLWHTLTENLRCHQFQQIGDVQLERGSVRGVSEDILDAIGQVLQLDDVERAHLFELIRAARDGRAPDPASTLVPGIADGVSTQPASGGPSSTRCP